MARLEFGQGSAGVREKTPPKPLDGSERDVRRRWAAINLAAMHTLNRNEVEELLARVDREGMGTLSPEERQFLDRMSGG
jgi:hypothetical protein